MGLFVCFSLAFAGDRGAPTDVPTRCEALGLRASRERALGCLVRRFKIPAVGEAAAGGELLSAVLRLVLLAALETSGSDADAAETLSAAVVVAAAAAGGALLSAAARCCSSLCFIRW